MNDRDARNLETIANALTSLGTTYAEEGNVEASVIGMAGAGVMASLKVMNTTLEEIRDELKGEK